MTPREQLTELYRTLPEQSAFRSALERALALARKLREVAEQEGAPPPPWNEGAESGGQLRTRSER